MAAKKNMNAVRPSADSPAPESIRVDPGSAMTEELKARHPELPLPVFSTMALEHGKNAAGASAVKEGFSWNPQMDLLWALGYPHVVLIVDGLPEGDSRASLVEHWNGEGRGGWLDRSEITNGLVISRRGAHAILWELELGDDPFDQEEEQFAIQTEPRSLDPKSTAALLRKVEYDSEIARTVLVVEALVGPNAVLEELCAIAENPEFDSRSANYRSRILLAALPLLRRVPAADAALALKRLQQVQPAPSGFAASLDLLIDPLSYAKGHMNERSAQYALGALQWADGAEGVFEAAYDLRSKFPDVPAPRYMYSGGEGLVDREVANAGKYASGDVAEAYLLHYTTIRSPRLLPVELEYLAKRDSKDAMQLWLEAHAAELRPWLEHLVRDPTHAKRAAAALEAI